MLITTFNLLNVYVVLYNKSFPPEADNFVSLGIPTGFPSTFISTNIGILGKQKQKHPGGGGGGGVLNKVLYGEASPRGPNPYPFRYHF